ncbi:MAG: TerB family tellurite resistance protein [Rhodospirillaceae bacterium]|nr:TerB family tellurite resistance protein [Rhodospirillaceae bacterium]
MFGFGKRRERKSKFSPEEISRDYNSMVMATAMTAFFTVSQASVVSGIKQPEFRFMFEFMLSAHRLPINNSIVTEADKRMIGMMTQHLSQLEGVSQESKIRTVGHLGKHLPLEMRLGIVHGCFQVAIADAQITEKEIELIVLISKELGLGLDQFESVAQNYELPDI